MSENLPAPATTPRTVPSAFARLVRFVLTFLVAMFTVLEGPARRLHRGRYALPGAFVLGVVIPAYAFGIPDLPAYKLIGNLFVDLEPGQLLPVGFIAGLLGWSSTLIWALTRFADDESETAAADALVATWMVGLFALLLPVVAVAALASSRVPDVTTLAMIWSESQRLTPPPVRIGSGLLGIALAWLCVEALSLLLTLVVPRFRLFRPGLASSLADLAQNKQDDERREKATRHKARFRDLTQTWSLFPDRFYFQRDRANGINLGHVFLFAWTSFVSCVYLWGEVRLFFFSGNSFPKFRIWPFSMPQSLFFVLLLVLMLVLLLGYVSFYLESSRHRLYFTEIAIVTVLIVTGPFQNHVFDVGPAEIGGRIEAADLVGRLAPDAGARPAMIVVAAHGGGIQAAAWTAIVLTSLDTAIPGFRKHLRVVSSASGGTVGTSFFVDRLQAEARKLDYSKDPWFRPACAAMASSLEAVANGLAYADFPKLFWPFGSTLDRGEMLERAWRDRTHNRSLPLSSLNGSIIEARVPLQILNVTTVEEGHRLMITPYDFKYANRLSSTVQDFYKIYGRKDVDLWTATRLSATFPFVTPNSRVRYRGELPTGGHHDEQNLADGGIRDNSGVSSAVDVIRDIFLQKLPGFEKLRVFILELDAFPNHRRTENLKGSRYPLTMPIEAANNVRGTIQEDVATLSITALQAEFPDHQIVPIKFQASVPMDVLSWYLTKGQKRDLANDWRNEAYKTRVKQFCRDLGTASGFDDPGKCAAIPDSAFKIDSDSCPADL